MKLCLPLLAISLLATSLYAEKFHFRPDLVPQDCVNTGEYYAGREKLILPLNSALVQRDGPVIRIRNLNGTITKFVDVASDDVNKTKGYDFLDIDKQHKSIIISEGYWEGGTFYIVNYETGVSTNIATYPDWSPSNKRFVVANLDLESQYTPNTVEIWGVTKAGFKREWSLAGYGGDKVQWKSKNEVEIRIADRLSEKGEPLYKRINVKQVNGTWIMSEMKY